MMNTEMVSTELFGDWWSQPMKKIMDHIRNYAVTLAMLATGLLLTSFAQATTASIPEPNTITLIGAGVVGAILLARYKARK